MKPVLRRMGTATSEELEDFRELLDAVLNTPEGVAELVKRTPRLLAAVNNSTETVLHWLAVENHVEGIKLLYSLGAEIPEFALIEALEMGHVETVALLLSLGSRLERYSLDQVIGNEVWKLSDTKKSELESLFSSAHRPN